jgi:hypothetical protein
MGFDENATEPGDATRTLSSSANLYGVQASKKINMYNQMSQVLLGYTGSANTTEIFESDLNIGDDDNQMTSCFFITLSRLIMKEQIKKGTFSMTVGTGSYLYYGTSSAYSQTLIDASASAGDSGGYKSGLPGGDYGVLYVSGASPVTASGVIFYQAGVIVLTSSFTRGGKPGPTTNWVTASAFSASGGGPTSYTALETMVTGTISGSCDALRRRIQNISFNNTTEINSKIYFCRVPHNKYNYSSNPTYTDASKIRVKDKASDPPISYVTTVGLYNASNELLAVAKLSEPLRKDPTNEITLRVRLDY